MNPLDRPVWASLQYAPHLAIGRGAALRYVPDVHCFAASGDDEPASLRALADLVAPGHTIFVAQSAPIQVPPGLQILKQAQGVQMVAQQPMQAVAPGVATSGTTTPEATVQVLGDDDAPDMLALAQLTEPGPFLPRTHTMGRFVGVRENGRLMAMAGERMRFAGATEVSGVCTHPEARGKGYARPLSALVTDHIQRRGDQAFLHAWVTNRPAIALYESLGYRTRAILHIGVLARP